MIAFFISAAMAESPPPAPLPDLTQGLATNLCEHGPGKAGATSYFTGELRTVGQAIVGTERWLLYPNQLLKDTPAWRSLDACVVSWTLTGALKPTKACADCQLAVEAEAVLDVAKTSCPEGLTKHQESMKLSYDIRKNDEGTTIFYFAESGKRLGEGYHLGNRMNFVSDPDCRWF